MLKRIEPQPGQESVWDYPRPPRVEASPQRIRVIFNGITLADSTHTYRVLETSHPPTYYIPQADLQMGYFSPTSRHTVCEFKGRASYWTITVGDKTAVNAAWSYPEPNPGFAAIQDHIAIYASQMEACFVDEEQVQAQQGNFYGGWITSQIVGPFKGGAGTWGW